MHLSKKVKLTSIVILLLVVVNAFLLLRENDVILKKYYLNDMHFAVAKDHEKLIAADAVVTSSNEHYIAAPVQAINEVLVTEGQTVDLMSELVVFKEEEKQKELTRLEAEQTAYMNELNELENVISQLDEMGSESAPSSAIDSSSIGDEEVWNVNLSVELGIEQGTPIAEGIAIVQRAIAETTRQIEVLDSRIAQLNEHSVLTSPVDGVVKKIVLEGDSIIFNIQSSEKKLVVYATSKQWQQIFVDQLAEITLFEGQEQEVILEGTVIEKQQIPARDSIAFEEMKKHEKVNANETVYEISIAPSEDLFHIPIGTMATANITVDEASNVVAVKKDWLIEVADDDNEYVYLLDEHAKTKLMPVETLFTYKTPFDAFEALPNNAPETEKAEDESTSPRIQTVDLKEEESEEVEQDLIEVAVLANVDDVYPIFLDETARNLFAPTFRPYPLQLFDPKQIESDWKLILQYWLQ